MMIISIHYFYRYPSNDKDRFEKCFTNKTDLLLEEIQRRFAAACDNGVDQFHPEELGFLMETGGEVSHGAYHELDCIEEHPVEEWVPQHDIDEFLAALEELAARRDEPSLSAWLFKYEHRIGETELVRKLFIAARDIQEAVDLGMKELASRFSGRNEEYTFFSVDEGECGTFEGCDPLSRIYFDCFPNGYPALLNLEAGKVEAGNFYFEARSPLGECDRFGPYGTEGLAFEGQERLWGKGYVDFSTPENE